MRKIITFNDLDLMGQFYSSCMRCDKTDKPLDTNSLSQRLDKDAPLEVIKRMLLCSECGQKDEITLPVISNEAMPVLGQRAV